jgi:hypothetical protein
VTITVAFVGGNTVVVSMGDTHGVNVLMEWEDPTPIRPNYIAVMTGWGSEGDWEFEPVEEPRTISYREEADNDACLQTEGAFAADVCSTSGDFCGDASGTGEL